ncbi:L-serine ammonia-lyase [Catalinimonas niigatensis]|uniref:L-serine ammonia-lyase n=1 Tax=Catalinimonas niigatensis TaxID=1397264 RepID=UPI0026656E1C|nr:L-serine ammonia-lyase [Catalinimonas niigatensis]WPP52706.1 L-serine ammonia-lyase [Catalinimonas niigatensis]
MEKISVFDMFKIGIGPSSSHTLGPWRAAQRWLQELQQQIDLQQVQAVEIHLYGSLALTGKGHGTDLAVMLGLSGQDPVSIPISRVHEIKQQIQKEHKLYLADQHEINFNPDQHIILLGAERLPEHANGMIFKAFTREKTIESTYYSVGGGFVKKANEQPDTSDTVQLPYPSQNGEELLQHCQSRQMRISDMVWANEQSWRSTEEVRSGLLQIWQVMLTSMYKGCYTEGTLAGGLNVKRRAAGMHRKLMGDLQFENSNDWLEEVKRRPNDFNAILKWIGCFAMAVNEENASFGRIVTAPTNGAAGVIPAVLMYYICFSEENVKEDDILNFLMVAGEIGTLFKKNATISAAMRGCQAEIGVSSAMAAAALTECLGGSVEQALMAAEIAMEHHLGLTCDPVGGLVQVPCIERNSMGAIKAITASRLALDSNPADACVSLDNIIKTMWETAKDMSHKYKETSQGGLAVNISVKMPEC